MSDKWYPLVDYEKCTSCLQCVNFCPHDVLKEEKGQPIVKNPDLCIDYCRGSQKGACDFGAISYGGAYAA